MTGVSSGAGVSPEAGATSPAEASSRAEEGLAEASVAEVRFRAEVETGDRGRVFVRIPFDPAHQWGSRGRVYITGTIAGHPVDGSLGVRGGVVLLPLSKQWRAAAGVEPGHPVDVRLAPSTGQPPDLPPDLAAALTAAPAAQTAYHQLATFYQRSYVGWLLEAKTPATRDRRLTTAIARLAAGRKLPTGLR